MRAVALDCAGDGTCRSSRGQTTNDCDWLGLPIREALTDGKSADDLWRRLPPGLGQRFNVRSESLL